MPATPTPPPGSEISADAALLARLKAGDDDAYAELVRAQAGRMLAVARRFLGEDDARDAVQDAFLNAFKALDRFDGRARLGTWLHRIVVNAALMRLRSRKRKPETSIEELLPRFQEDGHPIDRAAAWRPSPHDEAERNELRALVRAKIDELPDDYRNVLLLRDIEDLDTRETAELLGIEPGNVKVRLHRARQALRSLLDPHLREAMS